MIASSLREGDDVVDLLLSKGADATMKSTSRFRRNLHSRIRILHVLNKRRLQWPSLFPRSSSSDP